ncbi:MAG: type 1 glutamine amidotransferase [Devosiaceae bacterium]|nr:type 1 glutamine amidotransferase [Devosiaceae bacterium]
MKLSILLAGENPDQLRGEFGQYADKFKNMFSGGKEKFTFQTIAIHAGETIPSIGDLEGVIVTGSAYGAYDSPPWMEPLRAFIRAAYAENLPMLGICFGHQIIADALGGKVIKSEKGWSIGRHVYRLNDCPECFLHGPSELAIAASHQDQVVVAPKQAKTFLSSDFTPNAGLIYQNGVTISLQPHPEFEIAYSKAICNLRRNNPLDSKSVDIAVSGLDLPLDNQRVASALSAFFMSGRTIGQ